MILLTATFIYQYILRSVWWDPIISIIMITAVIRKWLLRPQRFILRTRTNQNASSCTKIYRRIVPRTRTNQNKALSTKLYCRSFLQTRTNQNKSSSTKLYCRNIARTWTNYVQLRTKNHNTLLQNKKTKGMRLNIMCLILMSLTYLNTEETIPTCHMQGRTWPRQEMNTLRKFLTT